MVCTAVLPPELMPHFGIKASAYTGNPYTALVNTTTTVTFNGKPWYIIADNSTAVDAGTVTLLAADTSFGLSEFDSTSPYSNDYSTSTVKACLDAYTTTGSFKDVSSAIADTANGKLYLLSTSEASALPENLRKIGFTGGNCFYNEWWLRSQGGDDIYAAFVYGYDGNVFGDGAHVGVEFGVRPALQLDLSKVTFDSSTKTFTISPWKQLKAAMAAGGEIKLTQNVTAEPDDTALTVLSDKNVILDLNGYTIDRALTAEKDYGYVIFVGIRGTLTIKDSRTGGIITGGKNTRVGGGIYNNGGTINIEGGSITGNTAKYDYSNGGGIYNEGTVNMSGGTISGNKAYRGGAIYNADITSSDKKSTFNMSGGLITGNEAYNGGGGIYGDYSTFEMSGGSITGNKSNYGGGIYSFYTTPIFKNGSRITITGNTNKTGTAENNVYIKSTKTIKVDSGELASGSQIGISTETAPTEGNPVNITDSYTGSAAFFTSDNTAYTVIKASGSTPAKLAVPPP
ncbi:MAG: hypothetical protein K6C13_15975 [Oscillospiraceae bacterium]|nr:hypothetical protein [Oscillospiraceae bacterium]